MVVRKSWLDKPVTKEEVEDLGVDHGSLTGRDDDDHTIYTKADGTRDQDYLDFSTGITPGHQEGRVHWNSEDGTIEIGMQGGNVILQVGQEQLIRCKNDTGDDMADGVAVYVSGVQGERPLITLADASTGAGNVPLGLTTEAIADGAQGYVCTFGLCRDIDTSLVAPGGILFLDESTPGAFRATPPDAPNFTTVIGYCLKQDATEGIAFVRVLSAPRMQSLSDVDHTAPTTSGDLYVWNNSTGRFELGDHDNIGGLLDDDHTQYLLRSQWLGNGFVDRSEVSLVWADAGPRTVTLDSVGASFRYFHDGVMYTETGALVATIADTAGIHAVYINGEGSMTSLANPSESQVDSVIENECIVAFVMWDGTDGRLLFEFHGFGMSPQTHHWIHDNIGAVYKEGMALSDFTIDDDGDQNLDAQFSVAEGEFYDEDLEVEIEALAVGDGMEIWYLDSAVWKWTTQGTAPNAFAVLSDQVGTGRLAYNNSGAQTEVTNLYYVLCHVFATNITADTYDGKGRYIAIQGQAQYSSKALARAGAEVEINALVYGTLPLPEIIPIATVIFRTATAPSMDNDIKATTISTDAGDDYVDWRSSNLKASGGSVTDHGALAGLADDDHSQYLLASGVRELAGHWNAGTDFDISVPQMNLTPRSEPLRAVRGGLYFDDEDDCVYVCTSAA